MSETILSLFVNNGITILVIVLFGASCGLPLPASLLLITAGALSQDTLPLWQIFVFGTLAAVIGDHVAYGLGRWGNTKLQARLGAKLAPAQTFMERWGMIGVFLSRWLITVVGGWLNLFCGMTRYPLWRFSLMDVAGEIIWVVGFSTLGYVFQSQVEALNDVLGNLSYAAIGIVAVLFFGSKLLRSNAKRQPIVVEESAVALD